MPSRARAQSQYQALEIIKPGPISDHFRLAVILQQYSNSWVRVETSTDLALWTEHANFASDGMSYLFVDEEALSAPRRFYRVVSPGTTPEQARNRWLSGGISDYRYRLRFVDRAGPLRLQEGIVEVIGGNKTVSNVVDLLAEEPLSDFDPADFPSPEELFASLAEIIGPDLVDCRVFYHPDLAYPFHAVLRSGGSIEYQIFIEYQITDFEILIRPEISP